MRASARLLVAREFVVRTFPRRKKIEITELLREPDLVVDHPFLLIVVAHLDEACEREILAQRMAFETVIGEQASHVGMADKRNAVEVVGLALEPIGAREDANDRVHGLVLAHLGL